MTVTARTAVVCAWPAMALAGLLLVPFLNTPFTIDDPIYLREAQQVPVDPLHPQAFDLVWNLDVKRQASQILPGGIFVPYLLIPAAMSGCKEWVGHLTQLVFLLAALFGAATIIVSEIDFPNFAKSWTNRRVLKRVCYPSSRIGRVMDYQGRAGFFSNPFGYLPWGGQGEPGCFEVWTVL